MKGWPPPPPARGVGFETVRLGRGGFPFRPLERDVVIRQREALSCRLEERLLWGEGVGGQVAGDDVSADVSNGSLGSEGQARALEGLDLCLEQAAENRAGRRCQNTWLFDSNFRTLILALLGFLVVLPL